LDEHCQWIDNEVARPDQLERRIRERDAARRDKLERRLLGVTTHKEAFPRCHR
jgi:hypothetical protein